VAVDDGGRPQRNPLRDKPIREGYGKVHNLYQAELPDGTKFDTFWDTGCTGVYISESLARKVKQYTSSRPSTMRSVGGKGPSVTYDALIVARFLTTTGFNDSFELAAGVIPNGTFPGDLTIGKEVCHK
jgi:hypothetical protein